MSKYNVYENLKFDPENYDPMDVGAMSSLLRKDPDNVRRRVKEGEWTIADLDKAITYVEDCESYIRKEEPDWQPPYEGDMREIYKDLLSQL